MRNRLLRSTSSRGYGYAHQQQKASWKQFVLAGLCRCPRCGEMIRPGDAWHLGHDDVDRSRYNGPEHAVCNLRAAAAKTNGRGRVKVSRAW